MPRIDIIEDTYKVDIFTSEEKKDIKHMRLLTPFEGLFLGLFVRNPTVPYLDCSCRTWMFESIFVVHRYVLCTRSTQSWRCSFP